MQRLGFENFTEEIQDVLKDHKQQQKVSLLSILSITSPPHIPIFTTKHLCVPIEHILTLYLPQDRERKVSKFEKSGLTEEELLRQQEELFAASRAKFQNNQQ